MVYTKLPTWYAKALNAELSLDDTELQLCIKECIKYTVSLIGLQSTDQLDIFTPKFSITPEVELASTDNKSIHEQWNQSIPYQGFMLLWNNFGLQYISDIFSSN